MEDQWIPIMKDGEVTDSEGRTHDGADLIEKAIATFDAKEHEPPVVIGHPKDNAPAYGWVSALKRQGQFLMAKLTQVQPEFEDMVKRGLYKKRSAAFYADGSLRHIGFLGAAPPAVKGMPDFIFNEGDSVVFEFTEHTSHKFGIIARIFQNLRDILIDKFDLETADAVVQGFDIDFIKEEDREDEAVEQFNESQKPTEEKEMSKTFTEEELEQIKKDAAAAARKEEREKVEAEFTEKGKANGDRMKQMEDDLQQQKEEGRKGRIDNFVEKLTADGKYLPAFDDMGVRKFLYALTAEEPIEFSEKDKRTPLEFMQSFLEALPKTVNLEEMDIGDGPENTDDKEALIQEFMEKNEGVKYKKAAIEVSKLHPELFK